MVDLDREIIPSVIPEDDVMDERVIASKNFMSNDNFVNIDEFKSFWIREKLKDMFEVEIRNFDKSSIKCTPEEGRQLVKKSDILLVLGWELGNFLVQDQIMRQEDPIYHKNLESMGLELTEA